MEACSHGGFDSGIGGGAVQRSLKERYQESPKDRAILEAVR